MASVPSVPTTEAHIPASFELGALVTKVSGIQLGMPCVVDELYTDGTINCVGINGEKFRKQDANNFVLFTDPRATAATKKALAPKKDKAAADIEALTKKVRCAAIRHGTPSERPHLTPPFPHTLERRPDRHRRPAPP